MECSFLARGGGTLSTPVVLGPLCLCTAALAMQQSDFAINLPEDSKQAVTGQKLRKDKTSQGKVSNVLKISCGVLCILFHIVKGAGHRGVWIQCGNWIPQTWRLWLRLQCPPWRRAWTSSCKCFNLTTLNKCRAVRCMSPMHGCQCWCWCTLLASWAAAGR